MGDLTRSTNATITDDFAVEGKEVVVRRLDFVSSFQRNWDALREILGIARPIKKTPGTQLSYKKVVGHLENGAVAEGAVIPYSNYKIEEIPYENISILKYKKGVTLEAIDKYGYEVAVQKTDEEFQNELTDNVMTKFYTFLNTGSLGGNFDTFQMALAMAKGLVSDKFKGMHKTAGDAVAFVNVLDFYEYVGAAAITVQTLEGFTYVKNFMGYNTIFLVSSEEVARGHILATPSQNLVMYYVDPADSDYARAGLKYTVEGETNLIGFWTQPNYDTAVADGYAVMGITLFAEFLDGIANVTFPQTQSQV